MKLIITCFVLLVTVASFAQKKEKIKGNKDVVEIYRSLHAFNQIEISDGLEVDVMQTTSEGYVLTADSNLIDHIVIEVSDSILMIYTTKKIVKSKKLTISLNIVSLDSIKLNKEASLIGKNKLNLNNIVLVGMEGSNFELDILANELKLQLQENAKGKLNLKTDTAILTLNDNSFLKGNLSIDHLNLNINNRADIKIEGNVEEFYLTATGSSDIKAKNLKTTTAKINSSNSSDIYLYSSKFLNIYANGRSNIYVYGNPEIKVEGLNDKSKIIKK